MNNVEQWIAKLIGEYDYTQLPGVPDDALATFRPRFQTLFTVDLPPLYERILKAADGLNFNGAYIYGITDGVKPSGAYQFGVLESNQRLIEGVHSIETPLRFIGEGDGRLFAFDTSTKTWQIVDRVAWEPDDDEDIFPTFDDLWREILDIWNPDD